MIPTKSTTDKRLAPVMALCVVLVTGMVAAINLAIPALAGSGLRPGHTALLWIVDGYVIVFACLLIPAGAIADRWGRKGTLLTGLAVFAAGLAMSGLAPSVWVLLTGRVITGIGAAAVLPTTLALMIAANPPEHRQRVIATWSSMAGAAGVFGNVGGGALLASGSWRVLFLGMLPLALIAFVLSARFAPRIPRHPRPVNGFSALLLTAAFVALLYGIIDWSLPVLGLAIVLIGLWVYWDLRAEHPLIDPRVFRIPLTRASSLGMTVTFIGMFGLFFLNGQYLQYAKGFSTLGAGLGLLPVAGTLLLAPRLSVPLTARVGARVTTAIGLALLTGGLLFVSTVDQATPYPWYAAAAALTASGCGLLMPVLGAGIMSALPQSRAGLGSGLQGLTREVGSALGVAIAGAAIATGSFTSTMPTAVTILAGVIAVTGALVVAWFPARR